MKVTADEGWEGWGEAFGFRAVSSAELAIDGLIGPVCIGRDTMQIASSVHDVQKTLHVFGRSGPLMSGLSAVAGPRWKSRQRAGFLVSRRRWQRTGLATRV